MSWSALSSLVAMPFGQLSPRKSESRACYLTNVAADKRSSGCAWLCHALLLTRLQLNFGVMRNRWVALSSMTADADILEGAEHGLDVLADYRELRRPRPWP